MVYFYDLQKLAPSAAGAASSVVDKISTTTSFLAISFFLLLWVLSTHQDWEGRTTNRTGQIVWLGFISNGVGIALFAGFVLLVKGV